VLWQAKSRQLLLAAIMMAFASLVKVVSRPPAQL
jgi:hypothetical protein